MTDEQGDYQFKYDDKFRKTAERKPLELGEAGITTIKLLNGPKGPVDWVTPPSLFPGQTITVEGAAAFPIFKHGICIAGKYHDRTRCPQPSSHFGVAPPRPADLTIADLAAFGTQAPTPKQALVATPPRARHGCRLIGSDGQGGG